MKGLTRDAAAVEALTANCKCLLQAEQQPVLCLLTVVFQHKQHCLCCSYEKAVRYDTRTTRQNLQVSLLGRINTVCCVLFNVVFTA